MRTRIPYDPPILSECLLTPETSEKLSERSYIMCIYRDLEITTRLHISIVMKLLIDLLIANKKYLNGLHESKW